VEYTFKNNFAEKPVTVILGEYSLSIQTDGRETLIPYANIISVRLTKSGKRFVTIIKPADQPEVQISNQYRHSNNLAEDRSPQYVTFVRVLHVHLKEKSMAYYVCGNNLQNILLASCASVIVAFGLSYVFDNVQLNPFNNNVTALILSLLSISLIAILNWGHFPNVYKAENIPLQFLPILHT
jgi:hypothetical protein